MVATAKATHDAPKAIKDVPRMASLKDASAVIKDGGCTIWGELPNIHFKSYKSGLGFTAKAQKEVKRACCTPKFSLPYFSKHCKKDPQVAQGSPWVGQTSSLLRQSTSNYGFMLHQYT